MKESILHYVWQNKLFTAHNLQTTDGEPVEIIDVGKMNTDAGPDFFNAKIRIGETIWAGNIEIHINSSEWNKHHHQSDSAYNNVILHIVYQADTDVYRTDGERIPQLELVFPKKIEENYEQLFSQKKWIPCADKINTVPSIVVQSWKNALLTERLEQKMNAIENLLIQNNHHWEEAFYITLARSFGFGTNSQAFESLAKSLPLSVLGKHKDHLFQLEALLFGQAGLLNRQEFSEYEANLKKEYNFLRLKYELTSIESSQWKLLRLRPDNFPHIRIAQFAALIHTSSKLFSKIVENPDLKYIKQLFVCDLSTFWDTHYLFTTESPLKNKKLGTQSINGILINTVVPFLFCYASQKNNDELKDRALLILEQIPPERNSIVQNWQNLGITSNSAYDSQALLQLKKQYCDDKKCLRCRIGHKVLTYKLESSGV
jgi:imidazoleglycerol phosphate dehydratase HisB